MALGDAIFINVKPGRFYEQQGTIWTPTERGFDTGRAVWETHPSTPLSSYPKRGSASSVYPGMILVDCPHEHEESGMVRITGTYRGILDSTGGPRWKERVTPGSDISMFTIPGLKSEGDSAKADIVAPVPKPKVEWEYLTRTQPTNDGVGLPASADFFPNLPEWSVSWIPDPDRPATINYRSGWILESRSSEQPVEGAKVWLVRETYAYYFPIST